MKSKISTLLIFLFAFLLNANAQKGTIRGKVFDGSSGESLIGATVIILNSSPLLGTVTDYDGNFNIENVPEGKYNIQVKYISYQQQVVENVYIENNKVLELNIPLSNADQNVEKVVISANSVKNSDLAILVKQKNSISVLNGLSAQSISNMGDGDAASAIKRLTGVSVEGGKYVFVRGLSDRYSKITLNGSEIPGLDPNKNTVQLDLFSANIIENIIVQKTFSPDLPASFAGGYVNITTKSFPNKFNLQFSATVSYNQNSNLRNDFLLYSGGKFDWLGIDNGSRKIPTNAVNGIPNLYENNDQLDKITSSFNKIMTPSTIHSKLDQNYSFSIANQFKIKGKPLGFIFDINYSNKYKYYNNGKYAKYNLVVDSNSANGGVMNPLVTEVETYGEQEITTSALLGVSYKLNPYNKIGVNLMRSGAGLSSARNRNGQDQEDGLLKIENTLAYQQRNFLSAQINGSHIFGKQNNEINWSSSFTKSRLYEPDLRFFNYDSTANGDYQISYSAYPSPARFYRDLNEINFDNKIHFSLPFNKFKFKFGLSYTYKNRISLSHKYDLLTQGLPFNGNVDEYLSDKNIGQNADATYGLYYQNDPLTDKYNSYFADEFLLAYYTMFEFKISEKVDVQTGVRYEYDYTFIQNMVESYQAKFVSAEKIYPKDFLPALNVNYHLSQNMNLRFAASRTLGRPAFREIAPYAYYDFIEAWRVVGNPELERTLINNVDLKLEKFMKTDQLVSVSGFVKYFYKPIELIDDPRANNAELHYVNADNSLLYGIELEFRKNLDFINLSDLMIGGNLTYLKSQVKYVDNYGNTTANDFIVQRPMYGQSPWVINFIVNYENEKSGISSNLGFNVDGPKLAVVTKGQTPDVYEQAVPLLNFNISKSFYQRIILGFSASNLLNSIYKKTYTYNNQEYIFQQYTLDRTFSFSIKYVIK